MTYLVAAPKPKAPNSPPWSLKNRSGDSVGHGRRPGSRQRKTAPARGARPPRPSVEKRGCPTLAGWTARSTPAPRRRGLARKPPRPAAAPIRRGAQQGGGHDRDEREADQEAGAEEDRGHRRRIGAGGRRGRRRRRTPDRPAPAPRAFEDRCGQQGGMTRRIEAERPLRGRLADLARDGPIPKAHGASRRRGGRNTRLQAPGSRRRRRRRRGPALPPWRGNAPGQRAPQPGRAQEGGQHEEAVEDLTRVKTAIQRARQRPEAVGPDRRPGEQTA